MHWLSKPTEVAVFSFIQKMLCLFSLPNNINYTHHIITDAIDQLNTAARLQILMITYMINHLIFY